MPTMNRHSSAGRGQSPAIPSRRTFLKTGTGLLIALPRIEAVSRAAQQAPTQFQIACMTLPYSQFRLQRALSGIQSAGYKYVAWGTTHQGRRWQAGARHASDAPPARAKELAARCRDLGLEPVMMFSGLSRSARRLSRCSRSGSNRPAPAGCRRFSRSAIRKGATHRLWVERFKELGPIARQSGVMIVVKQHGGNDRARARPAPRSSAKWPTKESRSTTMPAT